MRQGASQSCDLVPFPVRAVPPPRRPTPSATARPRRAQSSPHAYPPTPLGRVNDPAPEHPIPVSSRPASVRHRTSQRRHKPYGSTATNRNIRAGQDASALPTQAPGPNSRAADLVRSGKVDDPTEQDERFCRSETCTSGGGWDSNPRPTDYGSFGDLGGPWRSMLIRDVFADQMGLSMQILLSLCQSVPVLAVSTRPQLGQTEGLAGGSRQLGKGLQLMRGGLSFQRAEAPSRWPEASMGVAVGQDVNTELWTRPSRIRPETR